MWWPTPKRHNAMRAAAAFWALFILAQVGCQTSTHRFADPVSAAILHWQDTRTTDSLIVYLSHAEPRYRAEAALALASVQDTLAAEQLGALLLDDPSATVREHAAFALGQTGSFRAVNALIPALQDEDSHVVREAAEALGKTLSLAEGHELHRFRPRDSVQMQGLAWGLYRLSLRQAPDSVLLTTALTYLEPRHTTEARLAAAHVFARASKLSAPYVHTSLTRAWATEKNVHVRMALAAAAKHVPAATAVPWMQKTIADPSEDYRVKIGAIRGGSAFEWEAVKDVIKTALRDNHVHVQVAASELVRTLSAREKSLDVKDEMQAAGDLRVKSNLAVAVLQGRDSAATLRALEDAYPSADAYGKAHVLSALGTAANSGRAFAFVSSALLDTAAPAVVRTAAASALTHLNRQSNDKNSERFLPIYRTAVAQGDVAVIGIVAEALKDEKLGFRALISSTDFLHEAKKAFQLPRDIESLQPLLEAIAYLEDSERPKPPVNAFNHPIDMTLLKELSPATRVAVETTQGTIVMQLLPEEAPGSALNFMQLVRQGYFDGKVFHRVVSNFVIQTGCHRGDGYGSEDYSIRSEFSSRRYREGAVGMASAGKDTEGTQWFITHSATPHLEGRYTIFAHVVEGMDVVHKIGVGDRIVRVTWQP